LRAERPLPRPVDYEDEVLEAFVTYPVIARLC
jgi:hypothetical protein